jgi:hypothetical protein
MHDRDDKQCGRPAGRHEQDWVTISFPKTNLFMEFVVTTDHMLSQYLARTYIHMKYLFRSKTILRM